MIEAGLRNPEGFLLIQGQYGDRTPTNVFAIYLHCRALEEYIIDSENPMEYKGRNGDRYIDIESEIREAEMADLATPRAEFCYHCGAGVGRFRRTGEGTCPKCDPAGVKKY
jgi:hypothetical protein